MRPETMSQFGYQGLSPQVQTPSPALSGGFVGPMLQSEPPPSPEPNRPQRGRRRGKGRRRGGGKSRRGARRRQVRNNRQAANAEITAPQNVPSLRTF